ERFCVQIVAGTVAAVGVDRRRLARQVDEAGLGVDGDLRPDADVAGPLPRSVFPRLVAGLAGIRNRVEAPDLLAGARVVGADEPFRVRAVAIAETLGHRRPDDNRVVDDGRRRVNADLAALEIDRLVLADDDAFLEIDHAVLAEGRDRLPGLRVQLDQAVADREEHDAVVTFAVGPVRESAAGELPRRGERANPFVESVDPFQLAGFRV